LALAVSLEILLTPSVVHVAVELDGQAFCWERDVDSEPTFWHGASVFRDTALSESLTAKEEPILPEVKFPRSYTSVP
jgi:hypothetical protein